MKSDSIKNPSGGSGRSFVSGVIFLSLSTLVVKIIGLAYKIPMLSLLGAEGMGYFNSAYEIYALLCVISTAGLPVALSILVSADAESGRWQRVERIYRTAMALFGVIGGVGCIFMIAFAPRISGFIESPESVGAVAAIAPSLLFVCIASAVRGYFQGLSRMTPTALSQLIEAFAKLILGVWFAREAIARGRGIAEAAAFAVLGLSVGTLLSALYLLILKAINNKKRSARVEDSRNAERINITGALLKIALPITLGSALLGFTRVIDMALIMRRLQDIGYTAAGANSVYGAYTTLAVPIFGLIPSLITPISLALVPRLSSAIEVGSLDSQSSVVSASLRMTVLLAMPASMGVAIYARQILELLFSGQSDAIDTSAPLLSLLGISILFSCLITTANAILQSYRQTSKPIIAMAVGSAVKVLVAYTLIGSPSVGVWGAPISTLLCDVTVTAIDVYYIHKYVPRSDGISRIYLKPAAASVLMSALSFAAYLWICSRLESTTISFAIALILAVAAYFILSLIFGAVSREDIMMLPFGERISSIIEKMGFWRSRCNKY